MFSDEGKAVSFFLLYCWTTQNFVFCFFTERANIVTYTIKSHVLRSVTSNTYWNIKYSTSVFIINPTISIFSAFHFSKKKTQTFAIFHITIKSNKKGRWYLLLYQIYWKLLREHHSVVFYFTFIFFPKIHFSLSFETDYWWLLRKWVSTVFTLCFKKWIANARLKHFIQNINATYPNYSKTPLLINLLVINCTMQMLLSSSTDNYIYYDFHMCWKIGFSEKQNNLSLAQTQEKWQLLTYLVLGSDCKTAKLHPLGSVAILTARWTKASFWSRILSYALFVSYEQDISVEAFGRLDTSSDKNRQKKPKRSS